MIASLRREPPGSLFEDIFADYFTRGARAPVPRASSAPVTTRARMDVVDRGDSYLVTVDMPGVKKEDIRIAVDGAQVSIAAEAVASPQSKEGERVLHSERSGARYARAFELPAEVTEEGAVAAYEDGVLRLTLPRRAQAAARQIKVH
jgi:HSP20 family protein